MRAVFVAAVFCVLAGTFTFKKSKINKVSVHGYCTSDAQCNSQDHVQCPENDYERHCVGRPFGQCTCTKIGSACERIDQCQQDACPFHMGEHCIDGKCRCGLFNHIPNIGSGGN